MEMCHLVVKLFFHALDFPSGKLANSYRLYLCLRHEILVA
jgi:hypothetical protein